MIKTTNKIHVFIYIALHSFMKFPIKIFTIKTIYNNYTYNINLPLIVFTTQVIIHIILDILNLYYFKPILKLVSRHYDKSEA